MNAQTKIKMPAWLAVQTKPGGEYRAMTEMQRLGIPVYMAQYRHEYRHPRSKAWITKNFPLFLGYIFTPAHDVKWGALNSCDGLVRNGVLCDAEGKPVPIPGEDIKDIKDAEEKGVFDKLREHGLRLKPGEGVTVLEGAFSGVDAELVTAKSVNSVRVLLSMFGGKVVATGPVAKIEKKA
ncbi:transcription termination/antitermination NusG family protein [Mesorhizobium sp. M0895]|uniref:transcription termination/antitermination protein NusG n=1 Tax=Mesorhizobium sp. M0895 TaxID=2957019 RepID=UPI003334BBB4